MSYDCLSVYADNATSWSGWESPWVDDPSTGYPGFAASANHTVIVGIQLAPRSVTAPSGSPDPAAWEASCASGSYNGYAKTLAGNLVSAGLGRAVIRLGIEMNGNWEADYAGTTAGEQQAWARCFAQEVSAMRSVSGADFLFDWNVNACVDDDNLSNLYPGNASVDIVGVDAYDAFCNGTHPAPSAATFQSLASEPDGLDAVTSFAASHGKPVSLPEWGTAAIPANGGSGLGDDGAYVKGIGQWVASNDVAFQTYFDIGDGSILPLTSANPNTLAAYRAAFG